MPANTKRPHQLPIGAFARGLIGHARVLGTGELQRGVREGAL